MAEIPDPMDDGPLPRGPRILDPKNPFGESEAAAAARRRRSLFLALGLVAFIVLVFVVTLVKLKANVLAAGHL